MLQSTACELPSHAFPEQRESARGDEEEKLMGRWKRNIWCWGGPASPCSCRSGGDGAAGEVPPAAGFSSLPLLPFSLSSSLPPERDWFSPNLSLISFHSISRFPLLSLLPFRVHWFSPSRTPAVSPERACSVYLLLWHRILHVTEVESSRRRHLDVISTPQPNYITWVEAAAARGATTLYRRHNNDMTTY